MTEQIHQKNIFNQNPNGRIFNGLYPGLTGIDPSSIAAQVKALQASQEREFKKVSYLWWLRKYSSSIGNESLKVIFTIKQKIGLCLSKVNREKIRINKREYAVINDRNQKTYLQRINFKGEFKSSYYILTLIISQYFWLDFSTITFMLLIRIRILNHVLGTIIK